MNSTTFQELYDRRSTYPLGMRHDHENIGDNKYISDELTRQVNCEFTFILLPESHFDRRESQPMREVLLSKLSLVGVFNVGPILAPRTAIKFNLYVFSRIRPSVIWFGELTNILGPFMRRAITRGILFKNELKALPYVERRYFTKYLESIDRAIGGGKKTDYVNQDFRLFGIQSNTLGDRLSIDYYKPEYIEAEAKFAHERTVQLVDIADIVYPHDFVSEPVYSVRLKDAKYPLKSDMLNDVRGSVKIARIQRGDIIINSFLTSAYQNLTQRRDLVIANSQIIVRLTDSRFSAEYVTAYLNSERMRAYFQRRKRGTAIQTISRSDLAQFEIVIPTVRMNAAAKDFLSSLGGFVNYKEQVRAINKTLFAVRPPADRPLQNELLADMHKQLQQTKNSLVRVLFEDDLREIEKCYKAQAYKGCLALCGSLLEALVLDWLSEIDNRDYFVEVEIIELRNLIKRLREAEAITVHEQQFANEIRIKRNLIHPKNYIDNTPLRKEVCDDIVAKLKPLVTKRYVDTGSGF